MPEIFKAAGADFEAFYLRHFKAIYRVCYAFLKNAEDAEDCTEDVFVRTMQANPSLENERHERAWLTTTAMNLCKDRLKHWWRQKVVPIDGSNGGHVRRGRRRARGAGRGDGAAGEIQRGCVAPLL